MGSGAKGPYKNTMKKYSIQSSQPLKNSIITERKRNPKLLNEIKPKDSSVMMPNHEKAVTPEDKFLKYSLDPSNPRNNGKADAYKRGLGYDKTNFSSLIKQISDAVTSNKFKPYEISNDAFGIKYKYRIPVTGPNDKTLNVIAVYQVDNGSNVPRLITNYIDSRKKQKKGK